MALDRARLARALMTVLDEDVGPAALAQRVCAACVDALPVEGVGLSLMGGEHLAGRAVLGASDETGTVLEQLQFDLGEGPCASAFADGQPVLVPDLSADEARSRWPVFTHALQTSPARALFAFPLQLGAIRIGAMDCYRNRIGSFDAVTEAVMVAEAVTLAVLQAQFRDEAASRTEQGLVSQAVGRHAVVHQATGMVSAQLEISTDEAFMRLRAFAFSQGQSVLDASHDIVTGRRNLAETD
jgi:GAF domain-containing protein